MAIKGTNARILVEEWDLSCETSTLVMENAISEEDCTTLCSTAAEYTPVLPRMRITQDGYMSSADEDGSFEKELYNRMGVPGNRVAAMFGIDDPACPVYILDDTFGASMEIAAPAAGIITLNGAWGVGRGGKRGIRLLDEVVSATGTRPPVDMGAAGALGGFAYVFVQAITGSLGTATVAITHATTSGGTYSTLATLSPTQAGSVRIAWSGASNRWLRVNVTSLGGATALEMVVVACVNGVTQ
jgi:hypothetical protein